MWKLTEQKEGKRVYVNSLTGSRSEMDYVYTDKDGNKWYHFRDLTAIPHVRKFAAMKVSALYTLGLSKVDLIQFINSIKNTLKSQDAEKYEKAYGLVLDFQSKAENATDAIKQIAALTTVYFTMNDENIDSYEQELQIKKMALLESDSEMQSFFFTKQIETNERYQNILKVISETASHPLNEK